MFGTGNAVCLWYVFSSHSCFLKMVTLDWPFEWTMTSDPILLKIMNSKPVSHQAFLSELIHPFVSLLYRMIPAACQEEEAEGGTVVAVHDQCQTYITNLTSHARIVGSRIFFFLKTRPNGSKVILVWR